MAKTLAPKALVKSYTALRSTLGSLAADKRGNVLMMFGFAVIPLTVAAGMGIDYSRAARLQTKLNAAADAAVLAAVTQPMMLKTDEDAKAAAIAMFNSQVANLGGLIYSASDLTVTITAVTGAVSKRTASVSYKAKSVNSFSGILGSNTLPLAGLSQSSATVAPNIDFYLALDTSPSMALPTTTTGFGIMDNAVKCSFACHSNKIERYVPSSIPSLILDTPKFSINKTNMGTYGSGIDQKMKISADGAYIYVDRPIFTASGARVSDDVCSDGANKNVCIYNADNTYVDSYWFALNRGVRLRVTDERIAASDLMTLAKTYADNNNSKYQAALYTFDHKTNFKTISNLSNNLPAVGSAAAAVELVTVNDQVGGGCPPGPTCSGTYLFTSFDTVLTEMANKLPATGGNGTKDPTDTPQAFLFMVTDGMSDEDTGSGRTRSQMQNAQIAQCKAIKQRNIKIAILYTEYTAASIADDEPGQRGIVTANIPKVADRLTKCASPGLMYTVKTDQSISDALQSLFIQAISTPRLLQ